MQFAHHRAVKSMKTACPSLRAASTCAGENGSHTIPSALAAALASPPLAALAIAGARKNLRPSAITATARMADHHLRAAAPKIHPASATSSISQLAAAAADGPLAS